MRHVNGISSQEQKRLRAEHTKQANEVAFKRVLPTLIGIFLAFGMKRARTLWYNLTHNSLFSTATIMFYIYGFGGKKKIAQQPPPVAA